MGHHGSAGATASPRRPFHDELRTSGFSERGICFPHYTAAFKDNVCQKKFASGKGRFAPCAAYPHDQCQLDNAFTHELPMAEAIKRRPMVSAPCMCQTGREVPVDEPYAGRPLKRDGPVRGEKLGSPRRMTPPTSPKKIVMR